MDPTSYDIGDAARYLGVAPSTLRYWERAGLVRAGRNRANDYRRYTLHDLIDAGEIAFYRRLGVPVRELARYRTLSVRDLDDVLARTSGEVERRIAELQAVRARLARQRDLDACAEELAATGMRPGAPAIARIDVADYRTPNLWPLLVEEPWRYGVVVDAATPNVVVEGVVDTPQPENEALWVRGSERESTCLECLLTVAPDDLNHSNAPVLFAEAARRGIEGRLIVGSYLLTATSADERWEYYHAWVVS